jgi:hypothetical protein
MKNRARQRLAGPSSLAIPRVLGFVSAVLALATILLAAPLGAYAGDIDDRMHHLRAGGQREWADFPAEAEGPALNVRFHSSANRIEHSLRVRQQDVRQLWKVTLNGKPLGNLIADENDTTFFLPIPAGVLVDGENALRIESTAKVADDIRVGEFAIVDRPVRDVLAESTVEVAVFDERTATPCRITIINDRGSHMAVGAKSGDGLAVRPGVVYTADGKARFGVPAGKYTIVAGRGFEYGVDSAKIELKPGETGRKTLTIRREVPMPGYASCDTHVHTLTHSGHGDATIEERVITIAGEGIELPVSTDHNKQIDYGPAAEKAGVRRYFTPIVGNEVTTSVGHVNIFPVQAGGPLPDHQVKDWASLFDQIATRTGARIRVLNHPRDRHAGFVPFGPKRHIGVTGENLDGWKLDANAMEVVNSGAQQSDVLQLYRDWFGLLNRGMSMTPVGSSDSHDVSRYIVGQGRTYVRCARDDPARIDLEEVVASFREGRVLVSCGLVAELTVADRYGPGDLAPAMGDVSVSIRVLGPGWTTADRVALYVNGIPVKEEAIKDVGKAGVKWSGTWTLPKPKHDVHLVAVATGPGDVGLFWPIARPYQPTSAVVKKRVIGSTGAVWIDGDGDRKRTAAYDYARQVHHAAKGQWPEVVRRLAEYDEAVATQAAGLLLAGGISIEDKEIRTAARAAGAHVERGFTAFSEAWRASRVARAEKR